MGEFRISVMQPTMEPIDDILDNARAIDRYGFDTIWMAENYPWWRKHSMEARSATAQSPLVAQATKRVRVGWGIITPYSRHPIEIAMETRVMQEVAGEGRFCLGLGTSKIFMRHIGEGEDGRRAKPLTAVRESIEIIEAALEGRELEYRGAVFEAHLPRLRDDTETPRWRVPVYVAGTGPKIQQLGGAVGDGLLTPSITTPAFVRYARENVGRGAEAAGRDPGAVEVGATLLASISEDREEGREGAREFAAMYLANKVQNIRGSADVLLELAGIEQDEIRPIAQAMEEGGRMAAKRLVTDELLAKVKPIAGTPEDCIAALEEYRAAGCDHAMLEIWGADRVGQIELFGERVLPHFGAR